MVGSNGNPARVGNVCRSTHECIGWAYASFLIGRGIGLNVDGVFELTDLVPGADVSGELWWEVCDLDVGDTLYLSQALLTTATFLTAEAPVAARESR